MFNSVLQLLLNGKQKWSLGLGKWQFYTHTHTQTFHEMEASYSAVQFAVIKP